MTSGEIASPVPDSARPLIGVTTYHREVEGRPRFTLPAAYVDAVREAGGAVVLLAPGESSVADLLPRLDGLVLTGGGDLDPAFGAPPHPATYFTSPERDGFEVELARAAIAQARPMLAICRGLQILNSAFGGTLHAHLPEAVGREVSHRLSQDEATEHGVEIEPASALAEVLGANALDAVPSWHHQCIDRLGEGLRPVARAPDGVVEAVEVADELPLLAVQWHPELERPGTPGRRLFECLVEWSRER